MTTPLSAAQRAQLVAQLTQRQNELDAQVAEHHSGRSRAELAADWMSAQAEEASRHSADREVDLAMADRELFDLGQVSLALRRSREADFGQCGECGEPIAFARLQLEPWALRCVRCEAALESKRPARSTL
jgi:RNA polymerase-binding transcription factor DksA